MCIICERELWGEHRALECEFFKPCKTCKKFPGTSSEGTCYHCFAIGGTIDECPECAGKPWSEEFLEAKNEIEGPDKLWFRSRGGKIGRRNMSVRNRLACRCLPPDSLGSRY